LLAFSLKPDLKPRDRTRFFRELHGYVDRSNCGQYVYQRRGFLSGIPHVHLIRAAVIVRSEDKARVTRFLRKWASIQSRTVVLTRKDQRRLFRDRS